MYLIIKVIVFLYTKENESYHFNLRSVIILITFHKCNAPHPNIVTYNDYHSSLFSCIH